MLIRLVVLVLLAGAAVGIALLLQRRRPDPPAAPSYRAPAQLDRAEFAAPQSDYLIVVFASTGCSTCPTVWEQVEPLASGPVAVQRLDVEHDPLDLHQRYRIDGVPTTVMVGPQGVVHHTFFGPIDDADLHASVQAMVASGGADGDHPHPH